jgi:hypothetical protein
MYESIANLKMAEEIEVTYRTFEMVNGVEKDIAVETTTLKPKKINVDNFKLHDGDY